MSSLITTTDSPEATRRFAAALATTIAPGTVIALCGPLGAGKTCFVQGLAAGLGVPATVPVNSPTYILMNIYEGGRLPLYHFDWYRLDSADQLAALGLEEYFEGPGVSIVEWADKFPQVLPPSTRWYRCRILDATRREITGPAIAKG